MNVIAAIVTDMSWRWCIFVALGGAALLSMGLAPSVFAGSISGTATSASSGFPVVGVQVSVWAETSPDHWFGNTDFTDAAGHYAFSGLPEADYQVQFSPYWQNYVEEYYNNKRSNLDADFVHVAANEDRTVDVTLAVGGRITGRVVGEVNGQPLQGVSVCAYSRTDFTGECGESDEHGNYAIQALRTDEYVVNFAPYWRLNYFGRWFGDATDHEDAQGVVATEGLTTSGIDEGLLESAGVSGVLVDAVTGKPLNEIEVCAIEVEGEEFPRCSHSGADGRYLVGGMDSGDYKLAFSPEAERDLPEGQWNEDEYVAQYYAGATTREAAAAVALTSPGLKSGVDVSLMPKNPAPPVMPPAQDTRPLPIAVAPNTYIVGSATRIWRRSATFRFVSSGGGSGFKCRMDQSLFRRCKSPVTYRHLSVGRHLFEVRAEAPGGLVDPSPARFGKFKIRSQSLRSHGSRR